MKFRLSVFRLTAWIGAACAAAGVPGTVAMRLETATAAGLVRLRTPQAGQALPVTLAGRQSDTNLRQLPNLDSWVVRGLYVNRWAAQSPRRMQSLIRLVDSTELNALVLDMKDEFGLNYRSADENIRRNAGSAGAVPNLRALLDTMKAHGIVPIARVVVFKDSVAARMNPELTIRQPDGSLWIDREGGTWVNPYDRTIQDYNIAVAVELATMGFREIQFDYIRFPEPYRSLPPQVFPGADGVSKALALAQFLARACPRIREAGALCTADVFGLVATVNGALEVGQHWEKLAPVVDVLLPMTYPSHYPAGHFSLENPNAHPYEIQLLAIGRARQRNEALGLKGERVRPYLQAFNIKQPRYGPAELVAQKRGVYEAGYSGWILWNPGSRYGDFIQGLEPETAGTDSAVSSPQSR